MVVKVAGFCRSGSEESKVGCCCAACYVKSPICRDKTLSATRDRRDGLILVCRLLGPCLPYEIWSRKEE